jgi:hypothetical protein
MADQKNVSEILGNYSSDILELQRHIMNMLKDQAEEEHVARYPAAQQLVTRAQDTVQRQINELEGALEGLDGEGTSWLKKAMGSTASSVMGMVAGDSDGEQCSKVLRNIYVATDAAALGNLMLYTTAAGFNDTRIEEMSGRHFDELAMLSREARELIPETVISEFADEGYTVDRSVVGRINQRVQQTWGAQRAAMS